MILVKFLFWAVTRFEIFLVQVIGVGESSFSGGFCFVFPFIGSYHQSFLMVYLSSQWLALRTVIWHVMLGPNCAFDASLPLFFKELFFQVLFLFDIASHLSEVHGSFTVKGLLKVYKRITCNTSSSKHMLVYDEVKSNGFLFDFLIL